MYLIISHTGRGKKISICPSVCPQEIDAFLFKLLAIGKSCSSFLDPFRMQFRQLLYAGLIVKIRSMCGGLKYKMWVQTWAFSSFMRSLSCSLIPAEPMGFCCFACSSMATSAHLASHFSRDFCTETDNWCLERWILSTFALC